MNSDKAIEDLFLAQTPRFDDSAEFMAKLTKRLDAVEFIKQYQERAIRRYRVLIAVAFVAGIVSGSLSMAWLLSTPADTPLFDLPQTTSLFLWLVANARLFVAAAIPLLTILAACTLASNIMEIRDMRLKMKGEDILQMM